jgi:hypothetical protein
MGECPVSVEKDPEVQLASFLGKFDSDVAACAEAALNLMRRRYPHAYQLVYDNYNALAIGFSPTEKTSEVIFSVAVYPRWVNFFFYYGKGLPDPERRLQGSGNQVRYIRLDSPDILNDPAIRALMDEAVERSALPFDAKSAHRMIIRSVSPKQRPRKAASKSAGKARKKAAKKTARAGK